MSEKKKKVSGSRGGYCPFPSLGHDTTYCIVTQQGVQSTIRPSGCVLGRAAGLRYGQPHTRHDRPAHRESGMRPRAAWSLGVCHDTKFCIMTGRNNTGCDTTQQHACARCDTTLCARNACGKGCIVTQILCRNGGAATRQA